MKEEYRYTDRSLPGSVPESAPEDGYYTDLTEAEETKLAVSLIYQGLDKIRSL